MFRCALQKCRLVLLVGLLTASGGSGGRSRAREREGQRVSKFSIP